VATPAGLKTTSSTTVKLLWILVVGAVISVGLEYARTALGR
jgi:hypothetical protein